MKQTNKESNIWEATAAELSKLGYKKVNTNKDKEKFLDGDYLELGEERWAKLEGSKIANKEITVKNNNFVLYRK